MNNVNNLHPHDLAFNGITRQQEKVFFIQIGAADGKRADPIYSFVNRHNWDGILVEPLPDVYDLLVKNYNARTGLIFENVAITEKNESRTISRIPLASVENNKVPRWAFGISSLVPDKTVFASRNTPPEVRKSLQREKRDETIKCITFEALLKKHGITSFDILQIDTEGYDARIIMQIDFAKYKPKLINFEWQWLSDIEKSRVSKYLRSYNYNLYPCGEDMLASLATIESYSVEIETVTLSTVPVFFANVVGLISNVIIDSGTGSCEKFPAQIEFVRAARDYHVAIQGDSAISALLSHVDGKKNISEISKDIGHDPETVISWIIKLKNMLILE